MKIPLTIPSTLLLLSTSAHAGLNFDAPPPPHPLHTSLSRTQESHNLLTSTRYAQRYLLTTPPHSSFPLACACKTGHVLFSNQFVFHPGTAFISYLRTAMNNWSSTASLEPGCVFAPQDPEDLAAMVPLLTQCKVPFAVRGGGHMPVPGAANIDGDGVLVSLWGLRRLEMAEDKEVVVVGAGLNWGEVYRFVEQHGRTVVGGRLANVGVSGLLLGGGIGYFGGKFGFASDGVVGMDVVLPDGRLVYADAHGENKGVFYALRGAGAGAKIGIVANFYLRTRPLPPSNKMWTSQVGFPCGADPTTGRRENLERYLDHLQRFVETTDGEQGMIPLVCYVPSQGGDLCAVDLTGWSVPDPEKTELGAGVKVDNAVGKVEPDLDVMPEVFRPMFDGDAQLQHVAGYWNVTTAHTLAEVSATRAPNGMRHAFRVHAALATRETLTELTTIFYASLPALTRRVPRRYLNQASIVLQPITRRMLSSAAASPSFFPSPLSDALPADEDQYWYGLLTSWNHPEYDEAIEGWAVETLAKMRERMQELELHRRFVYVNDAALEQNEAIWEGMGETVMRRLRVLKRRYDPLGVFERGWTGGFKIPPVEA